MSLIKNILRYANNKNIRNNNIYNFYIYHNETNLINYLIELIEKNLNNNYNFNNKFLGRWNSSNVNCPILKKKIIDFNINSSSDHSFI